MDIIDFYSFWRGYDVISCLESAPDTLTIELTPKPNLLPRCGRCHQDAPLIHDRRMRQVRDRDLLDKRILLRLPVRRVDCLRCGRVTEAIDWLPTASRMTNRLLAWVEALLTLMPISHVSRLTGLHWHTIKTIDKQRLVKAVWPRYSALPETSNATFEAFWPVHASRCIPVNWKA